MKSLCGCGPSTNGVAKPLSVLQAVNGAIFAASFYSICSILGLVFFFFFFCVISALC